MTLFGTSPPTRQVPTLRLSTLHQVTIVSDEEETLQQFLGEEHIIPAPNNLAPEVARPDVVHVISGVMFQIVHGGDRAWSDVSDEVDSGKGRGSV